MRYAIVDTATGTIINVVEYEATPSNPPDGFAATSIAIQSDQAGTDWSYSAGALVAPPTTSPPHCDWVSPEDLMAEFTADDAAKIQAAIAGSSRMWLLWNAMTAQRDPMIVTNARFQAGWSALVQVLGQPRMDAIKTALRIQAF